ncbi:MAG: response regulator [Candidatus Brocadiaceae bacterium]|nr:response regulator [Candidatus Brocadiaceae bacterium]
MGTGRQSVVVRRLLLVENERHRIDELRDAFADDGYECEVALDFATARYIVGERLMDLAVVNSTLVEMPDERLVGELKAANPEMALVIYHGKATKARQRKLRRLGADSYLSKASDTISIIRAVRSLGERRGTRPSPPAAPADR